MMDIGALTTLLLLTALVARAQQCPCSHRAGAIRALYTATSGADWVRPWDMTSPSIPCGLEGVTCDAAFQDVTQLQLRSRGLKGQLPSELSVLTNLITVDMSSNMLSGTLSPEFSTWSRVNRVIFASNDISGVLSAEYANWTIIDRADFSRNNLFGALPIAFSNWQRITYFDVNSNGFVGTLPAAYSAWSQILTFAVQNNTLNGTLPDSFSSWKYIDVFDVSFNSLSGSLPESYGAWRAMIRFLCSANLFVGPIPAGYSSWSRLSTFAVGGNSLSGTLHFDYSLWINIAVFDVSTNKLSGSLPESYGAWTALSLFKTDNNFLEGSLPETYHAWSQLSTFAVDRNSFSGTLPSNYSSWQRMSVFVASSNKLTGSLPELYGAWTTLNRFDTGDNLFVGTLPAGYSSWSHLSTFAVGGNSLSGTLHGDYSFWKNITLFNVSSNRVSGSLPAGYSAWSQLSLFAVNRNSLSGTLPDNYSSWTTLFEFDVSTNKLSGSLPGSYDAWTMLRRFDSGDNLFTGMLPGAYKAWSGLVSFTVGGNSLSGTLHPDYSFWTSIALFNVTSNRFSGSLPESYSSWTSLVRFQVSNNSLSGSFSESFKTWSALFLFYAGTNQFSGSLPGVYSAWSHLDVFSAQQNSLSGTLPSEYGVWNLSTFSVGGNSLTGTLPVSYSSWTYTISFVVNSNFLSGTIPAAFGNMRSLQMFQGGSNMFTGTIPVSLVLIPTLVVFGVGYNQLTGLLPSRCSSSILAFVVQNNSGITGSLPQGISLFSGVGICGTRVCPTAAYPRQYCFPQDIVFNSADPVSVAAAAHPFQDVCTPFPDRTTSRTISPPNVPRASARLLSQNSNAAVDSISAVMYVSFVFGVSGSALSRGALPSLQRSASVLRMMGACDAPGGDTTAPMYSALADNPLALPIPIGASYLESAAGAALGNAVLVIAIGVGLHIMQLAQHRGTTIPERLLRLVNVLPSARLPGSLAVAYGTLLQPSVGASAALIATTSRSAQTIMYGCGFLCVWFVFPIYCFWVVVWQGRRQRAKGKHFALVSVVVNHQRLQMKLTGSHKIIDSLASLFTYATKPTQRWIRSSSKHTTLRNEAALEFLQENMETVYEAYVAEREWYFVVQWASAAASGIVLGVLEVVGNDNLSLACPTAYAGCGVAIAFCTMDIALTMKLRPLSVRLEWWTSVAISALCIISQALAAGGATNTANGFVTTAAMLELVAMTLLMLQRLVWRDQGDHRLDRKNSEQHTAPNVVPAPRVKRRRQRQTPVVVDVSKEQAPSADKLLTAHQLVMLQELVMQVCTSR